MTETFFFNALPDLGESVSLLIVKTGREYRRVQNISIAESTESSLGCNLFPAVRAANHGSSVSVVGGRVVEASLTRFFDYLGDY